MPVFVGQGNINRSDLLHSLLFTVISEINAAGGNAHYLDLRVGPVDGCGGHPGVEGNQAMFENAKSQIQAVMGW